MLPLHTVSGLKEGTTVGPTNLFHSKSIPLDLHVPDEVRAKIIGNRYVDLDVQLPRPTVSSAMPENNTFQLVDGSLKVVPSSKTRRIRSIEGWCTAFNIFIAVYSRAHPDLTANLMQYVEIVRSLAAEGRGLAVLRPKL